MNRYFVCSPRTGYNNVPSLTETIDAESSLVAREIYTTKHGCEVDQTIAVNLAEMRHVTMSEFYNTHQIHSVDVRHRIINDKAPYVGEWYFYPSGRIYGKSIMERDFSTLYFLKVAP